MNRPAVLRNAVQEFTSIEENLFVGNLYDGKIAKLVESELNCLCTMSWFLVLFDHNSQTLVKLSCGILLFCNNAAAAAAAVQPSRSAEAK